MENQTAPAANENQTGPMLSIQSVYLKDCSYEAPKGPRIDGNWSPQISLDINTTANVVAPELNEVVLTVTVGAKQGEATAFLVEVKQAGLFVMRGLTRRRHAPRHRHGLPERAVPVRARRRVPARDAGRLPELRAAAGGLRPAVRARTAAGRGPGRRARRGKLISPRLVSGPDNDLSHEPVAVLGAGSWGTALAIQFARAGHPTRLWSRNAADAAAMRAERQNRRYLPDAQISRGLEMHERAGRGGERGAVAIIVAVPSHSLRSLLTQLKPLLARDARLAWATKGFELDTGKLPHQVAYDVLGDGTRWRCYRDRRSRAKWAWDCRPP